MQLISRQFAAILYSIVATMTFLPDASNKSSIFIAENVVTPKHTHLPIDDLQRQDMLNL